MKGVKFGEYHSYEDFLLLRKSKEIGTPEPKKKTVEVEGADGELDYTEYFGEVKYSNRQLKFEFQTIARPDMFLQLFSEICDAIHGKKVRIVLEDDPDFFYIGRVNVSPFTNNKTIGEMTITADCEPYKYKSKETVISEAVTGSKTITLVNSRKRVVPTVTTTAPMTLTFEGNVYAVDAGTFVITGLELKEGENTITVAGTGTVTFEYQEGRL